MKKLILLVLTLTLVFLISCSTNSSKDKVTAANGMVLVDADGKKTSFETAKFKPESYDGKVLAVQVHATDDKKVCALGWYKFQTVGEVVPNTYNIEPKSVYLLYQDREPSLTTYNSKSGNIVVESNDGNFIKGSFNVICEDTSTKKPLNVKGTFNVPVSK